MAGLLDSLKKQLAENSGLNGVLNHLQDTDLNQKVTGAVDQIRSWLGVEQEAPEMDAVNPASFVAPQAQEEPYESQDTSSLLSKLEPGFLQDRKESVSMREARLDGNIQSRLNPHFCPMPADPQVPQPFMLEGMDCYTFMLEESSPGALQNYVDRTLNASAEGHLRYKVLMNSVIVYMAPIAKMYSTDEDLQAGWTQDDDAGFWIVLGEYEDPKLAEEFEKQFEKQQENLDLSEKPVPPPILLPKIILYPVGLYVGSAYTLISGREVYGFPKALGTHKIPTSVFDPGPFWVRTLMARQYDLSNEFVNDEVWSIHTKKPGFAQKVDTHLAAYGKAPVNEAVQQFFETWNEKRSELEELQDEIFRPENLRRRSKEKLEEFWDLLPERARKRMPDLTSLLLPDEEEEEVEPTASHSPEKLYSKDETWKVLKDLIAEDNGINFGLQPGAEQLLAQWDELRVFQVFLKQFRDAEEPTQACYQAVVEAPFVLKEWYGMFPMLMQYEFRMQHADSIDLNRHLGLEETMQVKAALWYAMTCELAKGSVRWVHYGKKKYIEAV